MRLIDADALEEKMRDRQFFYKSVKAAPTIEAAPVVRGRWEDTPYGKQCSVCESRAYEVEVGCLVNRHYEQLLSRYCPNCGANMKGEENDG